ncbi:DNA internalization-related competence protein ComEC/Rec2, partial [Candidatus Poribacteria bacterium]|nr:DNA internalization-related competence protein ComEC/Rec2 [Candidatus Poribacteria bacterium]
LGVIIGRWLSIPSLWLWLSALFCLIGSLTTRHRVRYLCYGLLHLAIFAGGMLRLETVSHSLIPPHFYNEPVSFSGTTTYQPDRGEMWDACYVTGELQLLSDPTQQVSSKFLVRFQKTVPLRYGKQVTLTGVLEQAQDKRNPGGFDYRAYLTRQGVDGIIHAKGLLRIGEQRGFLPLRWIEALRIRTEQIIDLIYTGTSTTEPSLHAQLLKGILLGKRSDLPTETLEIFRNSGTFHVLAVSGLHVGLIAMFCYFGFRCFRLPQKVLCLLTIAAVLIYACLIGFRPSVFRASLMAILFLFATVIDRDADLFNLLGFAALVLLLLNPLQLWDVGFQLSFVAVTAIVYFVPKMEKPLRRLLGNGDDAASQQPSSILTKCRNGAVKWLVLSYLVTLAAQIGTTPLIAYHFFRTYPLGIVVGPFAVGLVSLIVAVGMVSVCIGFIYLPFAKLLAFLNHAIISIFLALIDLFGQTSSVVKLAPPTFGICVLYVTIFLALANLRYVRKYWRIASLLGLSAIAIWVWDTAFHEKGRLLEVVTLDVGQGDATFVKFPDNRTMLVDGGVQRSYYDEKKQRQIDYDVGERIIEPYLDFRGIRKLDMVVLTHPDIDHGGGLAYILQNFQIGRVLGISDLPIDSQTHRRLHAIVKADSIPYSFPYTGEIELTPTATLRLLHPIDAASTNLMDQDRNNDSLVIKLTYREADILFTGDIGKKAETRLITSGADLRSEVLKVPHHGSRTSSTAPFIDAVQPRYAIFSLGQNSLYQFPHSDVINRYQGRGCILLRTDEVAAITLRTDGKRCWIDGLKQ